MGSGGTNKQKIGTLVMTFPRVMGGLERNLFQFSPFCDIKEGLKHFLLFVFPLFCVPHILVTLLPVVFGLLGVEGSEGVGRGRLCYQAVFKNIGFFSPRSSFSSMPV